MGQMHVSRPAGRRLLAALRRLGGSATSWQLATELRTHHLSADVASARCVLEEDGYDREDLVTAGPVVDDDGRRVYRYRLTRRAFFHFEQASLFAGAEEGR